MGLGHDHEHLGAGGHAHAHERGAGKRALAIVLGLTTAFTVAEVIGGILTGSLALLADAGHMLSDDLSLGLALAAIWLAERPATPNRSFGYQRAEVLAALVNGVTLVVISVWILLEAYGRFSDPPEVAGAGVLAVALTGMAVNVAGVAIIARSGGSGLNVSAAMRHLLADLLGSAGVVIAAIVILTTGWLYADPLISVVVALLIVAGAVPVLRGSVTVLLEASPAGIDADEVGVAMASTDGVVEVHDLHLWEVTSGFPALAAHVLVGEETDCHDTRRRIEAMLAERFDLAHTTIQVDHEHTELLQIDTGP